MAERERNRQSSKETDRLLQELTKTLRLQFEKKLKETKKHLLAVAEDSQLSFTKIKAIAKGSVIDIPYSQILPTDRKFSEESLRAIEDIREIKKDFSLTQQELARILGVSLRTVAGWLHLESAPSRLARDKISKVCEIGKAIKGVIKPQAAKKWLFAYNDTLGDSIFHLLEKGEYEKVLTDIEALKEGVFI